MMKRFAICFLSIAVLFFSCNKTGENIGIPNPEAFSKVYISGANNNPNMVAMAIVDTTYTLNYSAAVGGFTDKDVNVTFAVLPAMVDSFNKANGTSYKILPAEGYSLQSTSAHIIASVKNTGTLKISVKPKGILKPFDSYLLPVSVVSSDGGTTINKSLNTIYYVITGSYAPGQVPRQKVLSLGTNWGSTIFSAPQNTIILKNNNSDLMLYAPDATGNFSSAPRVFGTGFGPSETFYFVNETHFVTRNYPYWAGLFHFVVDNNLNITGGGNPFWLGDFWDRFMIVPYKEYLLTIDNNAKLFRQPILTDVNYAKTEVGSGFKYKQVLAYQNTLLALDENGKLWSYPMSADAIPAARREVGSGWDMYQQILVSGDDVLALTGSGDLYRYKFDLRGYFPLK